MMCCGPGWPGRRAGGPWRLVDPRAAETVPAGPWVRRADAAGLGAGALAAAAREQARAAAGRLDPVAGVMVQAVWLDAGPGVAGRLVVVIHHLVVDGVSWRILVPDLAAAWQAAAAGRGRRWSRCRASFRRWARLLAERAQDPEVTAQLPAWAAILDGGDPPLASRALDPAVDTAATVRSVAAEVPAEVAAALLTTVPAVFHGGVNDVLLAGLAVAVAAWRARRGQPGSSVLVDVEGHGREPGERRGCGPVADGGLVHQHLPGPAGRGPDRAGRGGRGRPGRGRGGPAGEGAVAGGARGRAGVRAAALPQSGDRAGAGRAAGAADRLQLPGPVRWRPGRRQAPAPQPARSGS